MEFESPDVEKEFPGLYASESGKRSNDSDFSDDAHERPSKKDLLIGKRKDKKDSKKDRGYAALGGESSPDEDTDNVKSPSKSKKSKSFKFPSSHKKEKREKSREKDCREKEREPEKEKKKEKEVKTKLKLKERKKSKHEDDTVELGDEQPVFGVALQLAVVRSRCHDGVDIPLVIRDSIDYIQEHALNMENIYKVSGIKSKVQTLRRLYNQREAAQLADYDPPSVTSVLKQFFRELPEPLLTTALTARFEEAGASKEVILREEELKTMVQQLPECNRQLLAWFMVHLEHVTLHEKQNKMNAQNIAITLSPVLQMSHRLLTAFLCHCKSLFPGIVLKKYVPPLSAGSPNMPDTAVGIADELRKQESLLNQIHQEMNAGFVSKRKEEQLWEVQRIITQLKRKLRTFQRTRDMSLNQKSMDEDHSHKLREEEFRINLTLQKAHSCSEEDTNIANTISLAQNVDPLLMFVSQLPCTKSSAVVSPATPHLDVEKKEDVVDSHKLDVLLPTLPATVIGEDTSVIGTPTLNQIVLESLDGSLDDVTQLEGDEELQGLLQEETLLQLEQRELLCLQADLRGRVQGERDEVEKLRAELAVARTKYNYRGFGCDSSEASSSPSQSDTSDAEDIEVETRVIELRRENMLLQENKSSLIRRIMAEREACLHLRVQLSLIQLSQESKQL